MKEKFLSFLKTAITGAATLFAFAVVLGLFLKFTDKGELASFLAAQIDNALFILGVYKIGELVRAKFAKK